MTESINAPRRSDRPKTPNPRYRDNATQSETDEDNRAKHARRAESDRNPNPKRSRRDQLIGQRRKTPDSNDVDPETAPDPPHSNEITYGATNELRIIAINCGGHLYRDRKLVADYVGITHPDVLVISETGLDDYYARQCTVYDTIAGYTWQHLTRDQVRKGRNRAISLLIRDKWLALIPKVEGNEDVCALYFTVRLEKWNIIVLAVYGEPDAPNQYWNKLQEWVKKVTTSTDRIIIIGDLNIAPNPRIDRFSPGAEHLTTSGIATLRRILEENQLEDIWRTTHGSHVQYTYKARREDENAPRPMSRVDLALTSTSLHDHITSCEILSGYGELTADHEPIELIVRLPRPIPNMEPIAPPPETRITEINVRALTDPKAKEEYQQCSQTRCSRRSTTQRTRRMRTQHSKTR